MSQHTPGPWQCSFINSGILGRKQIWLEQADNAGQTEHSSDIGDVNLVGKPEEVATANAYLLAAAPELLSSVEELINGLELSGALDTAPMALQDAVARARHRIGKARGES